MGRPIRPRKWLRNCPKGIFPRELARKIRRDNKKVRKLRGGAS